MNRLSLADIVIDGEPEPRLKGVSLDVRRGDCMALIGPNGAGKTTLLRTALGLEAPSRGQVRFDEHVISELSPRERAARLAWLPQRSTVHESISCRELVATARYRFDESHRAALNQADQALERVGLGERRERFSNQLSGGEFQRLQLAALLTQGAPFLLLDEPATHLDPRQQQEVYALLGELWREGRALVLVTHDINLLLSLGDPERIVVHGLREGRNAFARSYTDPTLARDLSDLFDLTMQRVETEQGAWFLPGRIAAEAR